MPLFARTLASYLDGGFISVGMSLGGGNALESERPTPAINTQTTQAYNQRLQAYNDALAKLKNNQEQTAIALKVLIAQLQSLNPSTSAFQNIVKSIGQIDTHSTLSDVIAYQNALNKILKDYANANQELLKQAEAQFEAYQQALNQAHNQERAILTNAIKTYQDFNH
ncbi:hypothetical protein ACFOPX_05455 [Helicobacter baculiformis]|uniref:Uncharacterized protein n=1 Tax=Helicobacter baculiformis TaxID=427351 RepID=A0ABV7ZI64_9HELI|nr:hypothetical protein [Helicobacter baculiformis]